MTEYNRTIIIISDLDGDVTTRFGDEFRECDQSIMGILTHVYLQSCNINKHY